VTGASTSSQAAAARQLDRRFVLCDSNIEAVQVMVDRLGVSAFHADDTPLAEPGTGDAHSAGRADAAATRF
jgi:hypothetical protein